MFQQNNPFKKVMFPSGLLTVNDCPAGARLPENPTVEWIEQYWDSLDGIRKWFLWRDHKKVVTRTKYRLLALLSYTGYTNNSLMGYTMHEIIGTTMVNVPGLKLWNLES